MTKYFVGLEYFFDFIAFEKDFGFDPALFVLRDEFLEEVVEEEVRVAEIKVDLAGQLGHDFGVGRALHGEGEYLMII